MAETIKIDARTRQQQSRASDPEASAWVSANAGSGKTFVLAQRVVRLLLNGVDPSRILCLTFTKAAASEMANRVFKTLGDWARLDDLALAKALENAGAHDLSPSAIAEARTLFAKALDTPGGLKIQTIHAFCEALLHRFPLEANVSGNFSVLDDATQTRLLNQAKQTIVLKAQSGNDPQLTAALAQMMAFASDTAIDKVLGLLLDRREEIGHWLEQVGGANQTSVAAKHHFGFDADDKSDDLMQALLQQTTIDETRWRAVSDAAQTDGGKKSVELSEKISALLGSISNAERYAALRSILFTDAGEPRKFGRYPANSVENNIPGIRDDFARETERLLAGLNRIRTLRQVEETRHLLVFAEAMLATYRMLKRERGLLDFDDLIARTADLLQRSEARMWVLYKLDLGIEHILLDEAQDTSPVQWSIIAELIDEFFSGQGSFGNQRTMFAVGDEKQSIYSFQGARPKSFSEQLTNIETKAAAARQPFFPAVLSLSFRSAPAVLAAVDEVFKDPQNADGLTYGGDYQPHTASRHNSHGSVEVWDKLEKHADEEPELWHEAADPLRNPHPAERLARLVAERIGNWLTDGKALNTADGTRKIRAGDFLILVRSRDRFIPAITRALKEKNIPVAGADRLKLTDHIAVQDLIALGKVMVTPDDDLSLACLLKSPLLGLDENDLFDLAHGREASLMSALFLQKHRFEKVCETITQWQLRAATLPVYEFYASVLGELGGRKAIYERLGYDAEDLLDAFLAHTLDHERSGLPGLHAFLEEIVRQQPEIKREMGEESDQVRIMTVHAAKGLEAPVVFLIDKSSPVVSGQHYESLYRWGSEDSNLEERGFLWVPGKDDHGDRSLIAKADFEKQAEHEYRRLLYVAMTRAEDHLVICGYKSSRSEPEINWHRMVRDALAERLHPVEEIEDGLHAYRWKPTKELPEPHTPTDEHQNPEPSQIDVPDWLFEPVAPERNLPRPLMPSRAHALIEESLANEPFAHSLLSDEPDCSTSNDSHKGTVLHKLFEVLPDVEPSRQNEVALEYLQRTLPNLGHTEHAAIVENVQSVLSDESLAPCFQPETSRAEVPIMGIVSLPSGDRSVSGTVDRLAVLDDRVIILDFKTGRYVPKNADVIPQDYALQMALYAMLLSQIYPEKSVEPVIVWTRAAEGARIMRLPDAALEEARGQLSRL